MDHEVPPRAGVDGEEVRRRETVTVRAEELPSCRSIASFRRRFDPAGLLDVADGGGGEAVAELPDLSFNSVMPPAPATAEYIASLIGWLKD